MVLVVVLGPVVGSISGCWVWDFLGGDGDGSTSSSEEESRDEADEDASTMLFRAAEWCRGPWRSSISSRMELSRYDFMSHSAWTLLSEILRKWLVGFTRARAMEAAVVVVVVVVEVVGGVGGLVPEDKDEDRTEAVDGSSSREELDVVREDGKEW